MSVLLTTICYIKQGDQVLLLHRQKKKADISEGKYLGLGGKVDPGESPLACIIREVEEESGLRIEAPRFHGTISFPQFDGQDELMFVYTADKFDGALIDSPEGTLEWVPIKSAMELPMWEGDRTFLPWVFADKFFEAVFRYDSALNFIGHDVVFHEITHE